MQFNARVDGKINTQKTQVNGNLTTSDKKLSGNIRMGGTGGVKLPIDYEKNTQVINRPQINSVELIENKTSEELGLEPTIQDITVQDIDNMLYGG